MSYVHCMSRSVSVAFIVYQAVGVLGVRCTRRSVPDIHCIKQLVFNVHYIKRSVCPTFTVETIGVSCIHCITVSDGGRRSVSPAFTL